MVTTVNTKGQVTIPAALRERDGELIPRPLLSMAALAGRYSSSTESLAQALVTERARDRGAENA